MSELVAVTPALLDVALLPALLIVVPILAATLPLALGLRFERTGWSVALATCVGLFAATIAVAREVFVDGQVSVVHEVGGYPAPHGIELVADEFSTMIALLVTGTALGVLAYTRIGGPRGSTFYAGYLLLTGGLLGLTFTGDVFNMFVFLEIVGLATYGLIAKGDSAESAVAALKYLILGTLGASLYLLGVGFLFMATGSLNMQHLADNYLQVADPEYNETLVRASFAFIFVGFAIKVAQWPLHTWQPDAYQHAPDGVTPLIAALVSTVSAYALGRILFTVYGVDFVTTTPFVQEIILAVGVTSVMAGSILAVLQRDVKRMFAYSSVSQFGLIVAAYGLATPLALIGAIVHLVGHGLMKAGLFLGVGVVAASTGARRVRGYAGLADRRPVAAASIAVLGISLIGIPPSIGFIGKWYVAVGAVQAEVWAVAAVIFLSTMLTLLYVARLLEAMYFTPTSHIESPHPTDLATDGGVDGTTVSLGMVGIIVGAALLAVGLGFAGEPFYDALEPFVDEVMSND